MAAVFLLGIKYFQYIMYPLVTIVQDSDKENYNNSLMNHLHHPRQLFLFLLECPEDVK